MATVDAHRIVATYLEQTAAHWLMTRDVLVPRAERELLVELALARLAGLPAPTILDLGTGSGAIALALARELPDARITAVDASTAALAVARRNAVRLGLAGIEFLEGDWYAPVAHRRT